jgi:hypothetical protein
MENALSDAILNLYNESCTQQEKTLDKVRLRFAHTKVNEPLINSSKMCGKVPVNRHILEDDLNEMSIEDILTSGV